MAEGDLELESAADDAIKLENSIARHFGGGEADEGVAAALLCGGAVGLGDEVEGERDVADVAARELFAKLGDIELMHIGRDIANVNRSRLIFVVGMWLVGANFVYACVGGSPQLSYSCMACRIDLSPKKTLDAVWHMKSSGAAVKADRT